MSRVSYPFTGHKVRKTYVGFSVREESGIINRSPNRLLAAGVINCECGCVQNRWGGIVYVIVRFVACGYVCV